MSKQQIIDVFTSNTLTLFGAVTGTGIGYLILQGLGAIVLGGLSTLGAWAVTRYLIPHLNKRFPK
jgi:hypothetical protein